MPRIIPASTGLCLEVRQSQRDRNRVLGEELQDPRRIEGPSLFAEVDDQGYKQWLMESDLNIDQSGRGLYSSIEFLHDRTCDGYSKWSERDLEEMALKPPSRYHYIQEGAPVGSLKPSSHPSRAEVSITSSDPFASLPKGTRMEELKLQEDRILELAQVVRTVFENLSGNHHLTGFCGKASFQLMRLAEKEGLTLHIVFGQGHTFCFLPGSGRILDVTATQFNFLAGAPTGGYSSIYCAPPLDNPPRWHQFERVHSSLFEWRESNIFYLGWYDEDNLIVDVAMKTPCCAAGKCGTCVSCPMDDVFRAAQPPVIQPDDVNVPLDAFHVGTPWVPQTEEEKRLLEIAETVRGYFEEQVREQLDGYGLPQPEVLGLNGCCGAASFQMLRLAEQEGLSLVAVQGIGHFFTIMPSGCILDVTATQFNGHTKAPVGGYAPIHVGFLPKEPPPWHQTRDLIESSKDWTHSMYTIDNEGVDMAWRQRNEEADFRYEVESAEYEMSRAEDDFWDEVAKADEMNDAELEALDEHINESGRALASLMENPICRGPEPPWQPEDDEEEQASKEIALSNDCCAAVEALCEYLSQNCTESWEQEANEWMELFEHSESWLNEALRIIGEWRSNDLPSVSDPHSYTLNGKHTENKTYKDSSQANTAAGTIGDNPDNDSDPTGRKEDDHEDEVQALPDPAGRTVPGDPRHDPAPDLGQCHLGQAERRQDPQAQVDCPAQTLVAGHPAFEPRIPELIIPSAPSARSDQEDNRGDALRQPTYKSLPREEVSDVKTRVQMTSYFAGAYLAGNNDNFMCEAEGGRVLAALAPLKEVCDKRFPRKKGSKRLRIQITEQRKDGAYLKREKGAVDAFNLSIHGIIADEAAPLVEWLLRNCGIKRRHEDEVLQRRWTWFESAGPVGTEGTLQKPEGGTPSEEASCLPPDRVENRPNAVQAAPAAKTEGEVVPVITPVPAISETRDGYETKNPENAVQIPVVTSLTREQTLAICAELREKGEGRLADRLANAGGKAKLDLAGEALARLSA